MKARPIVRLILAILLLVVLGTSSLRVIAVVPTPVAWLPMIANTVPVVLPPADGASARLTVPPGFAIRIYASLGSGNPRLMGIGPDGHLYVAMLSAGTILRLPDRNGDGLSDGSEVALSGLSGPHSFEWYNNYLYVSENDKIRRANDLDGNGVYTFDAGFSIPLPGPQGHSTRTLHFGPDGKLYVTVGSSCNICDEGGLHATSGFDPRRAAMLRFNPDGTIPADNPFAGSGDVNLRPVWAYGLRNSVDFTWTPGGTLWASSHGSDNILDNNGQPDTLPPEELVIPVAKGLSHGWPYCYTPVNGLNQPTQNEVRDTRMALPNGFTCADAIPALFTAPAHAAPIGMGWGPASYWPAEYRDDLYQALHGSWNTNNPANYRDCKVERIEINNGQITGSSTLVGGFRAPNTKCGDATTYGRPADVVASPKGEMFISDDQKHRIYRLVYIGN